MLAGGSQQVFAKHSTSEVTHFAQVVRQYLEAITDIRVTPPNLIFAGHMHPHGSRRTAELIEVGAGHTRSDTVLYLPEDGVLFSEARRAV